MAEEEISIDTRKFFLLNLHYFIRYLFSGQVVMMLLFFSLSFILLPFSTLVYLFLNLFVITMAYKFSFDVLAGTASGNMSPNLRHNYLVTNVIVLKVAIVALLIEGTLIWMKSRGYDESMRFAFIVLTTFITPAIYMSLALTNSLMVALNPISIFKIIKTTLFSYVVFVLFWSATALMHEFWINPFLFAHAPAFINGMMSIFSKYAILILNFHIMGYIIFQKRHEFGLEAMGFEKIEGDHITVNPKEKNPIHERIKYLLAHDETDQAMAMILELGKEGDHSDELQSIYQQVINKKMYDTDESNIPQRVHVNLVNKHMNKAFNLVKEVINAGEVFHEACAEDVKLLLKHAVQVNRSKYVSILIKDFDQKYPRHPDLVSNYFIYAKVLYSNKESRDECLEILTRLIENYPNDRKIPEIKAWFKGVQLMLGSKNNNKKKLTFNNVDR